MSLNINLRKVEQVAKENLDAYSLKEIETSVDEYLREATKEGIANTISIIYQIARKKFQLKKETTSNHEQFWKEMTRLWYCLDSAYYAYYFHTQGALPFNYKIAKDEVGSMLLSIYGDMITVFHIAENETLGGLRTIVEAVIDKKRQEAEQHYKKILIRRHFEKYQKNFYAIQYIVVKYLTKYRPDLEASKQNNFMYKMYEDLENIVTVHLEDQTN